MPPPPRALLCDVFGTLVDWRGSLLDTVAGLPAPRDGDRSAVDWPAVVDDWRRAYRPGLDRVRAAPPWRDLDAVHAATLDDVLARHGVALPDADRAALVAAWHRLRPWPDVRAGLERLRDGGPLTATLSNGHVALLVALLRYGDLRVDAVLSAELAGSYKPDPAVYRRALELLRVRPEEAAMVAAHADDLEAAAALGLRPVFVRRPAEWGPGPPDAPPEGLPGLLVVDGIGDLADALGC